MIRGEEDFQEGMTSDRNCNIFSYSVISEGTVRGKIFITPAQSTGAE